MTDKSGLNALVHRVQEAAKTGLNRLKHPSETTEEILDTSEITEEQIKKIFYDHKNDNKVHLKRGESAIYIGSGEPEKIGHLFRKVDADTYILSDLDFNKNRKMTVKLDDGSVKTVIFTKKSGFDYAKKDASLKFVLHDQGVHMNYNEYCALKKGALYCENSSSGSSIGDVEQDRMGLKKIKAPFLVYQKTKQPSEKDWQAKEDFELLSSKLSGFSAATTGNCNEYGEINNDLEHIPEVSKKLRQDWLELNNKERTALMGILKDTYSKLEKKKKDAPIELKDKIKEMINDPYYSAK